MDCVSVMLRLPLPPAAPHHALQHAVCARAERARVCAAAEARAGVVSARGGGGRGGGPMVFRPLA